MTITYKSAGVDYGPLDRYKRHATSAAISTRKFMRRRGYREIEWSRGESAYLFEHIRTGLIQAFVLEGLGTANIVAENRALRRQFGRTFVDHVAISNAAMTFNDMITVGALPFLFGLHPALESGKYLDGRNGRDLTIGTLQAMVEAGSTYGPGETPSLRDIIVPGTMCLSGGGVGVVEDKKFLMNSHDVCEGLRIILLGSTGMHANGYTLARKIAKKLRRKYLTDIGDGTTYGEALLAPTRIYVKFTELCQRRGVKLVYGVNITGHGWRKLARSKNRVRYVLDTVPEIPLLFDFIGRKGPVTLDELYKTLNMGAGYAVFVRPKDAPAVMKIAKSLGIPAWDAGYIEKGKREVIIRPHGLTLPPPNIR